MKKYLTLLMISSILMLGMTGCLPGDSTLTITSEDEDLAGTAVTAGDPDSYFYKLFVLNEGQMGTNGASLDFLRFSDGTYVNSSFFKMNNSKKLGDVGNDIKIRSNLAWIVVNNSGLVEVINAINEIEYTTFEIPTPRNISFTSRYAFVTSWAGSSYDPFVDNTGSVYRIDLSTGVLDETPIEVGWQPEGIAGDGNGFVWVANSGGIHATTSGAYDDRLMVINGDNCNIEQTITVAPNLKDVFYDYANNLIWVTSFGDFYSVHSGVYPVSPSQYQPIARSEALKAVRYSCASCPGDGFLYVIGTEDEWNWFGEKEYKLYKIAANGDVVVTPFNGTDAQRITTPYGIAVNPSNGDLYITDAGDYVNPGKLYCFDKNLSVNWMVGTGVCPAHMALYAVEWY